MHTSVCSYRYTYTHLYVLFLYRLYFPTCYLLRSHKAEKYFSEKDPKNKTDVENEKDVKTVERIIDGVFFSQAVLYLTLTSSVTIISNYAS